MMRIRKNFKNVVIISMGGATLNPQTILSLQKINQDAPKFFFSNTTDPYAFAKIVSQIKADDTICLVISNSGYQFKYSSAK